MKLTQKIVLIFLISLFIVSCGKKGCPKINESEKCSELFKKS